jgi:hypothetical protein
MADDFLDIYRTLSRGLHAKAEEAGIFKHKSAKGDGRENVFTEFLRQRIGTAFGVAKGEVVDANGESSDELDAVVYDQTVSASLHDQGTRRVLRVDAVALVIEVRSHLEASSKDAEEQKILAGMGKLRRYFQPLPILRMILQMNEDEKKRSEQMWEDGLPALDKYLDVPRVVHAFFGYDGPAIETISSFAHAPHVDIVCVNGKYTLAKEKPGFDPQDSGPDAMLAGEGEDALGAFVEQVDQVLQRFRDARHFVAPGGNYYSRARRKRAGTLR